MAGSFNTFSVLKSLMKDSFSHPIKDKKKRIKGIPPMPAITSIPKIKGN
jgi:hypothetical protein